LILVAIAITSHCAITKTTAVWNADVVALPIFVEWLLSFLYFCFSKLTTFKGDNAIMTILESL